MTPRRRRWVTRIAVVLASALVVLGLHRLTQDRHGADIKDALSELPYEITYRDIDVPDGASEVVAGRAISDPGVDLDFAVTFGGEGRDAVEAPGGGSQGHYSVGNTSYYFNSNGHPFFHPNDSRAVSKKRTAMRVTIEVRVCHAVFGEDATCI